MENSNALEKLVKAYIRLNLVAVLLGVIAANIVGLLTGLAVFWTSIHLTAFLIYRYDLKSLDLQKIFR